MHYYIKQHFVANCNNQEMELIEEGSTTSISSGDPPKVIPKPQSKPKVQDDKEAAAKKKALAKLVCIPTSVLHGKMNYCKPKSCRNIKLIVER